jgi:hypothetical protein
VGALAHELGHVLGLVHEDRGCAAMNSRGSERGPAKCRPVERWEWRCRLLEHDDVAGAVALYGGRPRVRPASACPIYRAIDPPRVESAVYDSGLVSVRLRRPSSPRIPVQLSAVVRQEESYAVAWSRRSCSTRIPPRARFAWPQESNGVVEILREAPAAPGRYCLSIWALDTFVRPSQRPALVTVDVG